MAEEKQSSKELFETLQAMYVAGEDSHVDSLMQLCCAGMEKKPDDPIVLELLRITMQNIVNVRDRREVDQAIADLEPEERELYEQFKVMSDEQLSELAERFPQLREPIARIMFFNAEQRRAEEEIEVLSEQLRKISE
jgi:hypothetical protein